LLDDLRHAFYERRFQVVESNSYFFNHLRDHANGFVNHILLQFDKQGLFESGRPIAHIFVDIIASLSLLRRKASHETDKTTITEQVCEFETERKTYWHGKIRTNPDDLNNS
jgi:hypothetical protein